MPTYSINATIRDKYFSSASRHPGVVFPTHKFGAETPEKKLDEGKKIFYDKQLTEADVKLGETYPNRMNLPQQGGVPAGLLSPDPVPLYQEEDK